MPSARPSAAAREPSPNFFGFIAGGALYSGAVADYTAAVVNRYSGVFYGAPGAVRVGRVCLEWLAELLGYPGDCGADITSGGSIANLSAIVIAREHHRIGPDRIPGAVVYLTEQTHDSVDKALCIAGLSQATIRRVPLDDRHRLRPDELDRMVAEDRHRGLTPFLVVASAGSTDTGPVDPLDDIARVCEREGIWFHVDAAYGGAFALTDEGARLLRGIERSDSLVVDPHKGLFLPFGTGAVLVRDRRAMIGAFSGSGAYIEDAMSSEPDAVVSPAEMSPGLTRPFRALRWWFALQLHALAGRYTLRFAVLNFRTHLAHVDRAVEIIGSTARRLAGA